MERTGTTHDLVQDAIGNFGPWQFLIAILLALVKIPVAWHQLSIVVLAPSSTSFKCIKSETEIDANNSTPLEFDVENGSCGNCIKYEYNRSVFEESIITQWDLVCDNNYFVNIVQTVTMFGILTGNLAFGYIADRKGRKNPLILAVLLQCVTGFLSAHSHYYTLFVVFKFVSAFAIGGTMLTALVLLTEILGVKERQKWSVLYQIPFIFGHATIPLISYLTRTWQYFQMVVSGLPILLLAYYWVIPESPRWLLAMGRVNEAEKILSQAAKRNKIHLSKVETAIAARGNQTTDQNGAQESSNAQILDLFRTPNLRKRTLCICVIWSSCGICYFGLAQYVGTIDGNILINVFISAGAEMVGTLVLLVLISRVPRRWMLMGGNALAAISLFLITLMSDPGWLVPLASIGLVGISITFSTVSLYSVEVFPTVVRNSGLGLASACARVGGMIAPFIANMGGAPSWLPPLILFFGPLISLVLCYFLPETKGCDLPEKIADGENFGTIKAEENREVALELK